MVWYERGQSDGSAGSGTAGTALRTRSVRATRSTPGFTLGGLRTTVDAQVERPDGSAILGLYAAGACASNIAQDGKGYGSGTQLGEGSFFGRRAGRHAARLRR